MILVHRLRGNAVYLNPDLIESVEATPDTVITLIDGRKAMVSDDLDDVIDRILQFRASILVRADEFRALPTEPHLRVIPGAGSTANADGSADR